MRWFDDFWVFFEINFFKKEVETNIPRDKKAAYDALMKANYFSIGKDYYYIILTLSIFQGASKDEKKIQLFRAEWDNYDDNKEHPQPHWHFYPFKNLLDLPEDLKSPENFEALIELGKETGSFVSQLENPQKEVISKLIDIKNFHFAMNGQWSINNGHIHKINNESILMNWLAGLLGHIKEQLNFVK